MAVALDTAAVVAFLDRDDALHRSADAAIRKLIATNRFIASAVTFAEVLAGAHLQHHDEAVVRGFFAELVEILPVDAATAERAASLRAAHRSLRMPDALILATADAHPDVDAILTGDAGFRSVRGLGCRVKLLR
ncbi:MAG TPA: PIN domain-containing protein [Solirubrobacterales bacterium]|nr:PIN domain-containing protein [Solirubrobacterales bacterium]